MNQTTKTILIVFALFAVLITALWGLGDALFPLTFSFALAYLIFPLVKRIEKHGVNRSHAVIGVFFLLLLILVTTLVLVVPNLISDANVFIKELPESTARALDHIEKMSSNLGYEISLSNQDIRAYINEHTSELSSGFLKGFSKGVILAFSGAVQFLISILNFFLIPLFFFYVINDYEKISKEIKSFIPKSIRPKLHHYSELSNQVLNGYIRGQLMVAFVLGCLYGTGLAIMGLKFGFLIGFASGLLNIIPYAGFSIGLATALLMGLANHASGGFLLGILALYAVVQGLESTVITPKLVGDKVGLSPLITILVLIIGGNLGGLMGMLIAIPTAAIAKSILIDLKKEYQNLDIFSA